MRHLRWNPFNDVALLLAVIFLTAAGVASGADPVPLRGTWSGNWTPEGGVPDAVTVELNEDSAGKVTGKFLTPASMEFSKTSYDSKGKSLQFEAVDSKTGKTYKVEAKIEGTEGTELNGTLDVGGVKGSLRLIKWTYVPRVGR